MITEHAIERALRLGIFIRRNFPGAFGRTMRCSSAARCPALPLAQTVTKRRCQRPVHLLVARAEASQGAAESSQEGGSEATVARMQVGCGRRVANSKRR